RATHDQLGTGVIARQAKTTPGWPLRRDDPARPPQRSVQEGAFRGTRREDDPREPHPTVRRRQHPADHEWVQLIAAGARESHSAVVVTAVVCFSG
ncbi:hypothetical protein, partial [Pseudonocardia zijingensis]|uniref:hypothetical protein n=1 Tax=Pseudonocardia zijingensis TaxID=153376 RepID=UPI0031D18383